MVYDDMCDAKMQFVAVECFDEDMLSSDFIGGTKVSTRCIALHAFLVLTHPLI